MASLSRSKIYSRFFSKVRAYELLSSSIDEETQIELLNTWMYSAIGQPYVSRLFSAIAINEDDDDEMLTYTLNNTIDDFFDEQFILEVISYGMVLGWLEPQISTTELTAQLLGTSSEKFYSQANHLNELRSLRDDLIYKVRSLIRDRGYINNDYINGIASSASMREVESSS